MNFLHRMKYSWLRLINKNKNYTFHSPYTEEFRREIKGYYTSTPHKVTLTNDWEIFVSQVLEKISKKEPEKFLRWDEILYTMFTTNTKIAKQQLSYLRKSNWNEWQMALKEDKFGFPLLYSAYNETSSNAIQMVYHLALFKEIMGVDYSQLDYIFEFGGGYGKMASIAYKAGFRGKYILFDLPLFSIIQKYYLKNIGIEAALNPEDLSCQVNCFFEWEKIEKVVKAFKGKNTLFIATWSLSEAPIELSDKVENILRDISYILIAYQDKFRSIDNLKRFQSLQEKLDMIEWRNFPTEYRRRSYYLFGKSK